jgi:hypothetical protein
MYTNLIETQNTVDGANCTPSGYVWPLTTGMVLKAREGYPLVDTFVSIDQYDRNLDAMVRRGNLPASLTETDVPASGTRGIRYTNTASGEGFAEIAAVIVSFSLPQLNKGIPDVTFSLGEGYDGPPVTPYMIGRQPVPLYDRPSFLAKAPCPIKKHRFIWWGAYRSLGQNVLSTWLLHSGLELGTAFAPAHLEFDIKAIEGATFQVELIQVQSPYYRDLVNMVTMLRTLSGGATRVTLVDLNAMLRAPSMMAARANLLRKLGMSDPS